MCGCVGAAGHVAASERDGERCGAQVECAAVLAQHILASSPFGGQAPVRELEVCIRSVRSEEQVLRLHVSVDDALRVAVGERLQQVVHHLCRHLLRVLGVPANPLRQLSAHAQLLCDKHVVRVVPPPAAPSARVCARARSQLDRPLIFMSKAARARAQEKRVETITMLRTRGT